MTLRITNLSDNTVNGGGFLAEWGLSMLVETGDTCLLWDAGQGPAAVHNADILGIHLYRVDKIVLSHGHYDHTGGLRRVLGRIKRTVPIIAHPDIWSAKYHRQPGQERYIGMPYPREELESRGADFRLTRQPAKISDSIMTSGEIPPVTDFESVEPEFMTRKDGQWQADRLDDDLSLFIRTPKGLVILLGCAHRGIINTLYHARKITGESTIYAVLGGAHLIDASEERIWLTVAALKDLGVAKLGLSHCTGSRANRVLAAEFPDGFFDNFVGNIFEVAD